MYNDLLLVYTTTDVCTFTVFFHKKVTDLPSSVLAKIITVNQWSPNVLSKGHISYYTTIRGPEFSCNVIVSGYVTF